MTPSPIWRVLDRARWAPSGDNTQPWKFEILAQDHAVVHGFDTRDHCVYDLDGHPSQISIGALLETAAIAASAEGFRLEIKRRGNAQDDPRPTFELRLHRDDAPPPDPLAPSIERRSVQRRPLQMRKLSAVEKEQLERHLPPGYRVHWIDGLTPKLRTALLMFGSAHIRLTIPEAYAVHRDIIEWNCRYSEAKVPDQALGVDSMTTKMMRFVMHSWSRVQFFNRFLAGTWTPRLLMDFWPGIACGAHFALLAPTPPRSTDDYIAAGRAVQRFWLAATSLNLQLQPEVTPLVFARYSREQQDDGTRGRRFTGQESALRRAQRIQQRLEHLLKEAPGPTEHCIYMGRLGAGPPPQSRSLRKPLEQMIVPCHAAGTEHPVEKLYSPTPERPHATSDKI